MIKCVYALFVALFALTIYHFFFYESEQVVLLQPATKESFFQEREVILNKKQIISNSQSPIIVKEHTETIPNNLLNRFEKLSDFGDITYLSDTNILSEFFSFNFQCQVLKGYDTYEDFIANFILDNEMSIDEANKLYEKCDANLMDYEKMHSLVISHKNHYSDESSLKLAMSIVPKRFSQYLGLVLEGIEKNYQISEEILSFVKSTDNPKIKYFLSYYLISNSKELYYENEVRNILERSAVELKSYEIEELEIAASRINQGVSEQLFSY